MIKLSTLLAATAALALAAPAFAAPATAAAPAAKPVAAAPAKAKGPVKTEAKTPEGKACSAEADAKGLHGKARKVFRSKCKDDAKGGDKAAAPASTAKH